MIRADNSSVQFQGDISVISQDFVHIIESFRKYATEEMRSEKVAEKIIADLAAIAFEDDDDKRDNVMKIRAKELDDLIAQEGLIQGKE